MDDYQRFFTGRPTTTIAQDLLGRLVLYQGASGTVGGLIVETEAYLGEDDSASHAAGGRRTHYTESLYGAPGTLYIYQIRSHYCFDIVVQNTGEPHGILLRAIEPTVNVQQMIKNRGMTGVNVSNGPGKLMQALGIQDRSLDGQPMAIAPLKIKLQKRRMPRQIISGPRVGVNQAGKNASDRLRFYVAGNPYVSKIRQRDVDSEHYGWRD
ncbi:DNA-3-methyladenine glycosylase [Limosilactobacillus caecicola]|uniref:DNA-3-methyladenine glycosylase n=1 Tax=Limosilactobacillus caecicola TaxID=2941332 RepID=UPI00203ECCCB|nr:DNA-3-methyladenine glycosylase [Limosilactobacillus caecicola]